MSPVTIMVWGKGRLLVCYFEMDYQTAAQQGQAIAIRVSQMRGELDLDPATDPTSGWASFYGERLAIEVRP